MATTVPPGTIEDLFELVNDDPVRAVVAAGEVAERAAASGDLRTAAAAQRARGLAHDYLLEGSAAVADLDTALAHARATGDRQLIGEVQMTRAGVLTHAGQHARGLRAIDAAVGMLAGVPLARAMVQRGAMRTAVGSLEPAYADFAAAEPILTTSGDQLWLAHLAENRAIVLAYRGDYRGALRQFEDARGRYAALGHRQSVAETTQNLGWLAARRGDLTEAFRHFDDAEVAYGEIDAALGYLWLHRCWALLACHLAPEARALARRAAAELDGAGFGIAAAEAMAMQAEAALLDGAPGEALEVARQARQVFAAQSRPAWAAYASYLALRSRFELGDLRRRDLAAARRAAVALEQAGMRDLALHARILCGRTALALGDAAGGAADLDLAAQARRVGGVNLRIQAWLATALLRLEGGDRRGAASAIRSGISVADEYGAVLGALEARAGVSAHADELTALGLRLALEGGRGRRIFEWMERTRARALDFPSIVPPQDDDHASLLARLRLAEGELRRAQLDGEPTAALHRTSARLQEEVRRLNLRTTASAGGRARRTGLASRVLSGLDGRSLVELAVEDGRVHAAVLQRGRVTHHRMGPLDLALRSMEDIRFGLDRLARPGASEASRAAARLVVDDAAASLAGAVVPGVIVAGGEVIVVPPAELFPVPWGLLPPLRSRLLTVSPAARLWVERVGPTATGRAVVVAGPGLPGAAGESRRVGALYPDVARFAGRRSKVQPVLDALDGAALAHVVAHGSFRADNAMFSSLRLADGGLTVYDLARVRSLPAVFVLSACNAGITSARAGNETMGIVAGLLDAGVRCVIASTGLVPDTADTTRAMVALHRRLRAGEGAAAALAGVQEEALRRRGDLTAHAFVCFGAG